MKSGLKFISMLFLICQVCKPASAQAFDVFKTYPGLNYAVTPFAALTLLESLDQFPKLAISNSKLTEACSDYELRSIRKQLLQGYFRSTFEEVDGQLIHLSPAKLIDDSVEVEQDESKCFETLIETAYNFEVANFKYETYTVQRFLGLYEAYISLCDSFDDKLKSDLTKKALLLEELKVVLPDITKFHLAAYLKSLRKRGIITATETSKK